MLAVLKLNRELYSNKELITNKTFTVKWYNNLAT